ncbi:TetR/AcrR family transcriptional regulator [Actinocorallia sp. API 0066]|uniref:TetR/AcrR family transcriptional regulator n=1 Tax=Actinocorallia sp. API 0066 TaxID=2896846 RepID=UPI001E2E47F8|nr:TetR/AcrR family transcriptional regulator [Actinocorallia sp. API 0066]MCD0449997.1 TetR/AcrR family transcriptional regulator [Actinocorallia sp. API 0066]
MSGDPQPREPRADARRNRERLLSAAREVVAEQGAQASLRDVARRAGVGLGTLYRHFPNRDALLEALLGAGFDRLTARARVLLDAPDPGAALRAWLTELADGVALHRGLSASLVAVLADETSPLYASCSALREAGSALLTRAQAHNAARPDLDGTDLFTLIGALAWIADQPTPIATRRPHLTTLILDTLTPPTPTP